MLVLAVLSLSVLTSEASAQNGAADRRVGIGGMVGDPMGLTMKFRLARAFAIDLGAGFGGVGGPHFQTHMDFVWAAGLVQWPRAEMLLHFGVGPKLGIWDRDPRDPDDQPYDDNLWIGARAPVGLTWEFTERRLDVFFEIAPGFWIVQDLWFDLDASAGARFWF